MAAALQLTVIEGEHFRFHVSSESEPDLPHLVDLEPFNWNGQCDCTGFRVHHLKELQAAGWVNLNRRCRHIKFARDYVLDAILPKLRKEFRKQKQP